MKNPCDECIIKVNCTEVCPAKQNYKALLKNALRENEGHIRHSTNARQFYTTNDSYRKFVRKLNEHNDDLADIISRKSVKKGRRLK
jgi:formate hydrogenlyase subunit 6/NADH:ubiquinone oxidoreductase subunit I